MGKQYFRLIKTKGGLRKGVLETAHGRIETPFFMPIASKAAVKTLSSREVLDLGAQIILSNTYHLYLTPGVDVIKKSGGLHKFMNWPLPILTDSGGYQVFSLAKIRKIKANGVEFQSHLDGSRHLLTPEKAIKIQETLGSDIMMALDICLPSSSSRQEAEKALKVTTLWAQKCKRARKSKNLLFGIVQGGLFTDLRKESLLGLEKIGFDGYAIGGLAVGETKQQMVRILDFLVPKMPENKARYLMGVGKPEDIVEAVKRGVDMFDCVIPTRNARHGVLYLWKNKKNILKSKNFYQEIRINNSKYKKDFREVAPGVSFAYLHHLFKTKETLGQRIATLINLNFYLSLMAEIRKAI